MASLKLTITGMTCDHCRSKVDAALTGAKGVWSAFVDLDGETAEVDFDAHKTTGEQLVAAVESAGYGAQVDS